MKDSIAKFAQSSIIGLDTVIGGGGKCKAKSGSKKSKKSKSKKSKKSGGGCCSPCC